MGQSLPTEGKKFDGNKLRYDLVDPVALNGLAQVLTFGARKYGDDNWKEVEHGPRRYYAAAMRHLEAWRFGEEEDKESGICHLHHAAACIMFIASGECSE